MMLDIVWSNIPHWARRAGAERRVVGSERTMLARLNARLPVAWSTSER